MLARRGTRFHKTPETLFPAAARKVNGTHVCLCHQQLVFSAHPGFYASLCIIWRIHPPLDHFSSFRHRYRCVFSRVTIPDTDQRVTPKVASIHPECYPRGTSSAPAVTRFPLTSSQVRKNPCHKPTREDRSQGRLDPRRRCVRPED